MVMTKSEFLAALQHEVRILLHLAGKVDRARLDYRPTPKQRSTLELLQYLSMMGPTQMQYALKTAAPGLWPIAETAALARDFDQTIGAIAAHSEVYASLLAGVSDADLRTPNPGIDGNPSTRGAVLVNMVLCGCAAYRTQLFLYLKACGAEQLGTSDLWVGVDEPGVA
jgi:hypothetical protein